MTILFTICGRAGSKGFQNKNLKSMRDVPLVYYTLAVIAEYKRIHNEDNVIVAVNTDSETLCELVRKQDAVEDIIFVDRKEILAGDTVAKVEVIKDTYLSIDKVTRCDLVVDLDITSPYRRLEDVENIIAALKENRERYDLVFSVVDARRSPYFNMVEQKVDGNYKKICAGMFTARQQVPPAYELNASIYAYNPEFLQTTIEKSILDYRCGIIKMPDYLVLDIDSEEDFCMMEYLHPHFCERDRELKKVYDIAREM